VVQRAGALLRFNYRIVDAVAVTVPNINVLAALQRDMSVIQIVPDRPIYAIQGPASSPAGKGKPGGGSGAQVIPAGVQRVGPPTRDSNGNGVGVAILDTGIDFQHPDLAPAPQSFSAFGSSCQDDNGHGTHVTGIVAALDNGIDVIGVAPQATPYCVKVLNASGSGSDSTVIAGLDWVATNRATVNPPIRVVNMSLGREGTIDDNPALRAAVKALYDNGVVLVAAAGNDPSKEVSQMVPAGYPEVMAIASTTALDGTNACRSFSGVIKADTASYFTTDGKFDITTGIGITISAPGEDQENVNKACFATSVGILSTKLGGGTTRMSGTSMAAPHVAGVVARLIQAGNSGVEYIRQLIRLNAARVGVAPLDSPTSGYSFDSEREGIVQAR
jgi:subtilisin